MNPSLVLLVTVQLAILICGVTTWVWIGSRRRDSLPVLSYEPRRPVPWSGLDLLMILVLTFFTQFGVLTAALSLTGTHLPKNPALDQAEVPAVVIVSQSLASLLSIVVALGVVVNHSGANFTDLGINRSKLLADTKSGCVAFVAIAPIVYLVQALLSLLVPYHHPIINLVQKQPDWLNLALMGISAVVIAPVVEEFQFRVLLQGWLEKLEDSLTSQTEESQPVNEGSNSECNLPTSEFGGSNRSSRLFGCRPGFLPILVSSLFFSLMHIEHGAAMVPLFIFSLALGFVYRQTHRIVPSLIVHMLLNGIAMIFVFAELKH